MKHAIRALCALGLLMLTASTAAAQVPGPVTPESPADGATDLPVTPTFKWFTADFADQYRIRISTTASNAGLVLRVDQPDTTFTVADALEHGQLYYWSVRGVNTADGEVLGPPTDWSSFAIVPGGPTQVTLTAPADGSVDQDVEPILTWSTVGGAGSYHLQVSTSANFGTTVVDNPTVVGTQFQASLSSNSKYFWRVKASNAATLNWSEVWDFTTGSGSPERIVLTSPADGATNVSSTPELSWEADAIADEYRVQVATDASFSEMVHNLLVATPTWTPPALANATTHFWRVRGINNFGSGPFSTPRSFTVEPGGATQVDLISPSNGATDVDSEPVLSWNPVSGGAPYRIQISKSADFSTTVIDDANVNATQYDAGVLDPSTAYFWRVLAASAPENNWSATWSFTTGIGQPGVIVLTSPSDGATDVPVSTSFTWEVDPASETYRIQISENETMEPRLINRQGLETNSYTPDNAFEGGKTYYWRVRGTNSVANGPFSEIWSFTTVATAPGVVTLSSPANGASSVPAKPDLSWNPEATSDSYDVQIATTQDFAEPVVSASGLTETEFTSTTLANGTPHFWRVRGENVGGKGPWSSVFTFTTEPGGPQQVVLTAPANNSTDVALAPLLQWGGVPNAASYALQVSKQSNFASTEINRDAVNSTQFQTNTLDGDQKYYWRVRASNAGPSNWSSTWAFTTAPGTPDQVVLVAPLDKAQNIPVDASLRWSQAQKAETYQVQMTETEDDFSELFYEQSGIATTEHQVPGIVYGDVYWWRVRAVNESGVGEWSESWGYLTERGGAQQPIILSPESGETGVSLEPLLTWSAVPEELSKNGAAVTYHVQVATSFSFSGGSIVAEESANPDTTFQVTGLLPDTTYAWRVRASVAGPNNWTQTASFVTGKGVPGQVVLESPLDNATEQDLATELVWTVPVRATSFNLQVSLDSSFTSVIVSESGLSDVKYMLVGLDPQTEHFWRVQAVNQDGVGEWSDKWSFATVGLAAPDAPILISPLNGAAEVSFNPLFTWNTSEGASSYKIEISTSPTFSTVVRTVVVTQPFYQADGLLLGQGYYWRVEARNAGGANTSDTWGFTTAQTTDTETDEVPDDFALGQNYPNPFNPSTTIEFSMPRSAQAVLTIYNVRGEEIDRLVDGLVPAGTHRVVWNAVDLPSGVYLYHFQSEDFAITRKLTLTK